MELLEKEESTEITNRQRKRAKIRDWDEREKKRVGEGEEGVREKSQIGTYNSRERGSSKQGQ